MVVQICIVLTFIIALAENAHAYIVGCPIEVSEVIFVITSTLKDVCGKPPTERMFLDKYGKICLSLDEVVWGVRTYIPCCHHFFTCVDVIVLNTSFLSSFQGVLENTDKDRIKRLVRLKPPTEF